MNNGTRLYRLENWSIYVPEALLSQEGGKHFVTLGAASEGPFDTEKDLAVWLLKNRTRTVSHGIMTEYKPPPELSALYTDSQDDLIKIMAALVRAGIQFQFVPQDIESVFIYMVLISKHDRNAAHHALQVIV